VKPTLVFDANFITIRGAIPRDVVRDLDKRTSYKIEGARFVIAFRQKRWDGKEHLMKYDPMKGVYRVPIGMADEVFAAFEASKLAYEVVDSRKRPEPVFEIKWNPEVVLRPYQIDAINAFADRPREDPRSTFGFFKMAIRSGKTTTTSGLIAKLRVRTLFVVPSQMLLDQTIESFEKSLGVKIGKIGDGVCDPQDITVATAQSLLALRGGTKTKKGEEVEVPASPLYAWLVKAVDFLVVDEVHHVNADKWREMLLDFRPFYRLGLTATPPINTEGDNSKGSIWLKAFVGGIVYEITPTKLIELGFLMRPTIELHTIRHPKTLEKRRWSAKLWDEAIMANSYRNGLIVSRTMELVQEGHRVLVVAGRTGHIAALREVFETLAGVRPLVVTGTSRAPERKEAVRRFVAKDPAILIGTVFKEGVDIPSVEVVVIADGGADEKMTVQKMRSLTKTDGKTQCLVVDFLDLTNPYFAEHSKRRLRTYRDEGAFEFRIVEDPT
jgi:superfamily II DNA or RNA helicase